LQVAIKKAMVETAKADFAAAEAQGHATVALATIASTWACDRIDEKRPTYSSRSGITPAEKAAHVIAD
jgi:hypothetical protein